MGTFHQPQGCFTCIQVDDVCPLLTLQGYCYLFTRWSEAIPMETATSMSCTLASLSGWIAKFGIPEYITSDRGTTFTSKLWTSLANLLGIILPQTTVYKPAANGLVEDFHRTLKAALKSHCKDYSWFTQLSWVLLGLRTTPKDALDVSAAGMVYGDGLVVHPEFFPSATSSDNLKRLRHNVERFTLHCQTYKP
ncbi:uncharacterized protein [Palaemon carinicauda]|uniref:uncharacterized protein n=1 Tax=Palaemon carinicauda TaxID=392227 RepID=UPI0035B69A37